VDVDEYFMKKNVLFIQGGGEKGYEADAKLAASLQRELGEAYHVNYPPTIVVMMKRSHLIISHATGKNFRMLQSVRSPAADINLIMI